MITLLRHKNTCLNYNTRFFKNIFSYYVLFVMLFNYRYIVQNDPKCDFLENRRKKKMIKKKSE